MLTVVTELPEYIRRSTELLGKAERNELAKLVDVLVETALEKHRG